MALKAKRGLGDWCPRPSADPGSRVRRQERPFRLRPWAAKRLARFGTRLLARGVCLVGLLWGCSLQRTALSPADAGFVDDRSERDGGGAWCAEYDGVSRLIAVVEGRDFEGSGVQATELGALEMATPAYRRGAGLLRGYDGLSLGSDTQPSVIDAEEPTASAFLSLDSGGRLDAAVARESLRRTPGVTVWSGELLAAEGVRTLTVETSGRTLFQVGGTSAFTERGTVELPLDVPLGSGSRWLPFRLLLERRFDDVVFALDGVPLHPDAVRSGDEGLFGLELLIGHACSK